MDISLSQLEEQATKANKEAAKANKLAKAAAQRTVEVGAVACCCVLLDMRFHYI